MGTNKQLDMVAIKYKLIHNINEYIYHLVKIDSKWLIQFGYTDFYFTTKYGSDYYGHDTATFDSEQEAFAFWEHYILDLYYPTKVTYPIVN